MKLRCGLLHAVMLTLALLALGIALPSWAAPGDLDTSFGISGKVTTDFGHGDDAAYPVVIQPDGKIIAAGTTRSAASDDFGLARYNTDGSLDTSFGTGGLVTTDFNGSRPDAALALVVLEDGKILAGGWAYSSTNVQFALARYNTNGSLDTSFGKDGKATTSFTSGNAWFNDLAVQPDGKIVSVGYVGSGAAVNFGVVRHNADGSLDTSFGTEGKVLTDFAGSYDAARAVKIRPDGKILVAGQATTSSDAVGYGVACYNSDGMLDTSFGANGLVTTLFTGTAMGYDLILKTDGKFIVAGAANNGSNNDFGMAQYNADGSLDTTFGSGGRVTTAFGSGHDNDECVLIQSDGKIVLTGTAEMSGGYDFALARYNANGSLDTTFGATGKVTTTIADNYDIGRMAAFQSDGKIVLAGQAGTNAASSFALARYYAGDPSVPTVTTGLVTDVTARGATVAGNVTSDGGASVTERGVCFGTTAAPTNCTAAGTSGTGLFSVDLDSLSPGTKYYVRAYATNSAGTSYGVDANFTTMNNEVPVGPVWLLPLFFVLLGGLGLRLRRKN